MKIAKALKIALKNMLSIQMGSVVTDSATLVWDSEEELKAGDEVYVLDDNGDAQHAPDGEYKTEDGKVIVVADGKVSEIVDPEAEVADEEPVEEQAEPVEAEEIVPEPADQPEGENNETEEDRIAALEARLAEFTEGFNQIINSIAALEERIADVEGKLVKVEAPAADPIDDGQEIQEESHKSILNYLKK